MFNGSGFSKSLEDEVFALWLEKGRDHKIKYNFLLIIWDEYETEYKPIYVEHRDEILPYKASNGRESLVAVYDLYSEARIKI
jgi:hypothetical protein